MPRQYTQRPKRDCALCGAPFSPCQRTTFLCSIECRTVWLRGNSVERFWAKVNKDGPTPAHRPEIGPCWVWTASTDRKGYGLFAPFRGKAAHRASWTYANGAIPVGMEVCHACDNPPCIRPDHLFLGTHLENMLDSKSKGRMGAINPARGPDNPKTVLTADQVREIRRLRASGVTAQSIADGLGVSRPAVSAAANRRTWKYIE